LAFAGLPLPQCQLIPDHELRPQAKGHVLHLELQKIRDPKTRIDSQDEQGVVPDVPLPKDLLHPVDRSQAPEWLNKFHEPHLQNEAPDSSHEESGAGPRGMNPFRYFVTLYETSLSKAQQGPYKAPLESATKGF